MENEEQQPQEAETPEVPEQKEPDWKAEALKYKAIADRREKKLNELKSSFEEKDEKPKEINKPNTEGLTRDEAIFFAKGYDESDLKLASTIATANGVSILEATKDEYFMSKQEKKRQAEEDKRASLPASNATGFTPKKPIAEMTRDEHRAYYEEQMKKAANG